MSALRALVALPCGVRGPVEIEVTGADMMMKSPIGNRKSASMERGAFSILRIAGREGVMNSVQLECGPMLLVLRELVFLIYLKKL